VFVVKKWFVLPLVPEPFTVVLLRMQHAVRSSRRKVMKLSVWSSMASSLIFLVLGVGCTGEGRASSGATTSTEGQAVKEHRSGDWSPELTDAEKLTLFRIAQDTLNACTAPGGRKAVPDWSAYVLTEALKQPMHTFVTLKKKGELRGCIGSLPPFPAKALYLSVHEHTRLAALEDTRFSPVSAEELPQIRLHLSLLSPVMPLQSPEAFKVGEHGIIVEMHGRRGVFLPEVAVEQKWTAEQTLTWLCVHKAGLPPDAWKKGAVLRVFSSVGLSFE